MSAPKTLLQMAGAQLAPPELANSTLVLIDYQNEYQSGALPLAGINEAVDAAAALLIKARAAGARIIHVAHKGKAGGLFDRDAARGQIIRDLAPAPGEIVIEKPLPNAFAKTSLGEVLQQDGQRPLVVAGFMTHMCLSSTVRAALDLGYATTVVESACASRDLPDMDGETVSGHLVHRVALAELADRFALVVRDAGAFREA
ncbi:cysteine hydrolase family protein [Rhodoligotrophos defluvii]|uniref:cysteine hydrolase family protein n=1 Tax=Rhodoligotrophos defluvii TaxID=2561934 RepID=UPI0010C99B65|nr:cysteine hydrolase family protein [Rhodoligotrophos defluvii]